MNGRSLSIKHSLRQTSRLIELDLRINGSDMLAQKCLYMSISIPVFLKEIFLCVCIYVFGAVCDVIGPETLVSRRSIVFKRFSSSKISSTKSYYKILISYYKSQNFFFVQFFFNFEINKCVVKSEQGVLFKLDFVRING